MILWSIYFVLLMWLCMFLFNLVSAAENELRNITLPLYRYSRDGQSYINLPEISEQPNLFYFPIMFFHAHYGMFRSPDIKIQHSSNCPRNRESFTESAIIELNLLIPYLGTVSIVAEGGQNDGNTHDWPTRQTGPGQL